MSSWTNLISLTDRSHYPRYHEAATTVNKFLLLFWAWGCIYLILSSLWEEQRRNKVVPVDGRNARLDFLFSFFVFVFLFSSKKYEKLITYLIGSNKALSKQTTDATVSQETRSIFRLTMNELFTLLLIKSFRTRVILLTLMNAR